MKNNKKCNNEEYDDDMTRVERAGERKIGHLKEILLFLGKVHVYSSILEKKQNVKHFV